MSSSPTPTTPAAAIAADTSLGAVSLTVSDLARSRAFYETALGLSVREADDGALAFACRAGPTWSGCTGTPSARALDRRATGLYHLAILFPTRLDLAHALARLARPTGRWTGSPITWSARRCICPTRTATASSSTATARATEWSYADGQLQMATVPLDLRDLADELATADGPQPQRCRRAP